VDAILRVLEAGKRALAEDAARQKV
jgi:hypothetical protein